MKFSTPSFLYLLIRWTLKSIPFHWKNDKTLFPVKTALQSYSKGKLNRFSVMPPPPNPALSLTHRNAGQIISAKTSQFPFMLSSRIPSVVTALLNSLSISLCFLTCQSQAPDPSHYSSSGILAEVLYWIWVLGSGYFFLNAIPVHTTLLIPIPSKPPNSLLFLLWAVSRALWYSISGFNSPSEVLNPNLDSLLKFKPWNIYCLSTMPHVLPLSEPPCRPAIPPSCHFVASPYI